MTSKHPHLSHPKYRPDIDGLRALAVLPVVAFHAFPDWVRGGFVGVDIFFVISGYLISTIMFENLERGSFSFLEFYARRIRRIFPALILVLLACYAFGRFALLPDELKQLGKHMAASSVFISNFVLWGEAGYFDNAAETKPLLHLWSLGVEEQYYIVWPLLLWLAWKRKFNLLTVTLLVGAVSFYLNVKGVRKDAVAAFYSPQTRFWELFCGSLLAWLTLHHQGAFLNARLRLDGWLGAALYRFRPEGDGRTLADVTAFAGMALLAYSFLRIHKEYSFPGKWAALPVLGAVLLIAAGARAWPNRTLLSNRLAIGFGLISYPLYLWHWPLLSFARIVESETPGRGIRIAAVALAVALAWLTYRLVERPLRFGKRGLGKVLALSLAMLALGGLGYKTFTTETKAKTHHATAEAKLNCDRLFPDWTAAEKSNACLLQKKAGNTIAIVGDSHAAHLYIGLSDAVPPGEGVAVFPASCAAPFINTATAQKDISVRKIREGTYKLINQAYDYILKNKELKSVLLAHQPWCSYQDAIDVTNPANSDYQKALQAGMRRTFSALVKAGKQVIVVYDNPLLPYDPKMCVVRPFRLTPKADRCSFPREQFDSLPFYVSYRSLVENVLRDYPQVRTVDLSELLCDKNKCYLSKNGVLLYADEGHLNYAGSQYVAPYLLNAIKAANNQTLH